MTARNWTIRLGRVLSRMVRRGRLVPQPIPPVALNSDLRRFFRAQLARDPSATLATAVAELLADPAPYTHGPPETCMSATALLQMLILEQAHGADVPLRVLLGGDILSQDQQVAACERMRDELRSGAYVWRSVERLASAGGISAQQAVELLAADPDVELVANRSKRPVAALKSRVWR